jgi:L-alanine-DL-glutamate epimerase-like enolase superfamily enzyme
MKAAIVTRERTLQRPIQSARQIHDVRTEVALVLSEGDAYGVGVVSPQPQAVLGDPGTADVLDGLQGLGLRRLHAVGRTSEGRNWAQVHGLFGDTLRDRWTATVIEAAVLDLEAAESSRTWIDILGRGETSYQCVASLVGVNSEVQINPLASRYRVKVSGDSTESFAKLSEIDAPVLLDFNGDSPDVARVTEIVELAQRHADIVGVEQAWSIGDFNRPAELRRAGLRVSHDESMRCVGDLRHGIRYEAVDEIALKPARCGGVAVVRDMARRAGDAGVAYYIGGFFEGPLGRFRNHVLAMTLGAGPSDVLDIETGLPVTAEEAESDKLEWTKLAERQGKWVEVGG